MRLVPTFTFNLDAVLSERRQDVLRSSGRPRRKDGAEHEGGLWGRVLVLVLVLILLLIPILVPVPIPVRVSDLVSSFKTHQLLQHLQGVGAIPAASSRDAFGAEFLVFFGVVWYAAVDMYMYLLVYICLEGEGRGGREGEKKGGLHTVHRLSVGNLLQRETQGER